MPYLGRHSSASRPDWGYMAPGEMLGATFDALTEHLWAYEFGLWGGKYTPMSGNNVTTRLALYATNTLNPANRLGYSDAFTVSTAMADAVSGASHAAAINAIDVTPPAGATFTGIPLASGFSYHLAALGTGGYLAFGMIAAAKITAANEKFYRRSGLSQPPPTPFGAYTASNEGHPVFWMLADANLAPDTPTGLAPSGTILSTTPAFEGIFADANTNRGDYLNQYRIQVRGVSDGASFWNVTFDAASSERGAGLMQRAYGGTTLVRGTAYEWRCQMSDHFGAWSAWTAWTQFTPTALGTITLNGTPNGWIASNTPNFQGRWTHQTAVSMKRVQMRIWNADASLLLQTGADYDIADVASSAAPGTLFTFNWANTGLADLARGTTFQYDMRGYDGTQWSDWSAKRTFNTNAPPNVPTLVAPADGWVGSARPLLEVECTDPDATGTLAVSIELLNTSDVVQGTYAATRVGVTNRYQLQTTSTHLPSFVARKWRAYSYDQNLYSGGAASAALATRSETRLFEYAAVPAVTVTGPISPVTTSQPVIAWTSTNQTHYRVRVYQAGAVVYDSGTVASAAQSMVLPGGYVRNDTAYTVVVDVTDTTTLTGSSAPFAFNVDYPDTNPVQNMLALPVSIGTDLWDSAVRISWDQTAYATGVWQRYTVYRDGLILRHVTSPSQTVFTDYTPVSGQAHTYAVTQTIMVGLDTLESAPFIATAGITLQGVVLVSVSDPETVRTTIRHTNEREFGRTISEAVYEPVNGRLPVTVRNRTHYRTPRFDFKLFADTAADAAMRRAELERVDMDGGTFCYRDNHGRKLFVTIPDMTITDQVPDWYTASLELREEEFVEGLA